MFSNFFEKLDNKNAEQNDTHPKSFGVHSLLARFTLTAKLARRLAKRLVQIIVHTRAWAG